MKNGQLKVWHIPQVPMKPFEVYVDSPKEAAILLSALAAYDLFQEHHNVKGDFSNAAGLMVYEEETGEWYEWYDEYDDDIDAWMEEQDTEFWQWRGKGARLK